MTKKQKKILVKMEPGKQYDLTDLRDLCNAELSDLLALHKGGYIEIPEYHERGRNFHYIKEGD